MRLSEEKQTAFVWIPVFSHSKQIRVQGQREIQVCPSFKGASMKTCCFWSRLWHFSEITVITLLFCCFVSSDDYWSDCENYREQDFPPQGPRIICKYKFHNPFVIECSLHICVVLYCVKTAVNRSGIGSVLVSSIVGIAHSGLGLVGGQFSCWCHGCLTLNLNLDPGGRADWNWIEEGSPWDTGLVNAGWSRCGLDGLLTSRPIQLCWSVLLSCIHSCSHVMMGCLKFSLKEFVFLVFEEFQTSIILTKSLLA